jgi:NDP-sugar pyrophosphorylase family protein
VAPGVLHCSNSDMRIVAAILAGGLGTRLRPVLGGVPKPLAPVRGRPFLYYLLDRVDEISPSRIVICAGHRGGQFERELESRSGVVVAHEDWPMETAGALRRALDFLDADTVLTLNGDSYVGASLARFCHWRESQPYRAALLVTRVSNCAGLSTVDIDPPGRISGLHHRSTLSEPGWINTGVCLIPRSWIEQLPADTPLSLERDVLPYWLERGVGAYCVHAPYINIATPKAMAEADAFFAAMEKRSEMRAPAAN